MKKLAMLLAAAALVSFTPVFLAAQMCGPGQCMVEPGMRNNMGLMSGMMGDMNQMLQSGKMTPAQQKHLLEMMNQMSGIMNDMGSTQAPQMQAQLQQRLQQLQKTLQELKARVPQK
jgi:hypothetical protein